MEVQVVRVTYARTSMGMREPEKKYDFERSETLSLDPPVAKATHLLSRKLLTWGVEARGISPVPVEERTEKRFIKIFFIWLSANANILSFSAGTLGPVAFRLDLPTSCVVIMVFTLLAAILPSYFATWGPKLGLRQMCTARYTFGYYGVMLPSLLFVLNGVSFCVLNCILGGQALASIANISWTVGIVIIAVISLFVSFCGIKVLSMYANCAWIPVIITFIVAATVNRHHFVNVQTEPASMVQILNFGATVAGFTITWSTLAADFTTYFHPDVPGWRIFVYSYLGLTIPIITLQCLGAAAAISGPFVPGWAVGYTGGNVGGLINAMLLPVNKLGKVLMILLSLSVTANNSPTIYSMGNAFQTLIPPLVVVPRYVFSVFSTAVVVLLAIVGQHKLYDTLPNFLGMIGCWAGAWASAVCVEHLYFRKRNFDNYDLNHWNVPSQLPLGAAALGASFLSFLVVIPSISQVWYIGPIARKTGDLGLEAAVTLTALLYIPLRSLEKRWMVV